MVQKELDPLSKTGAATTKAGAKKATSKTAQNVKNAELPNLLPYNPRYQLATNENNVLYNVVDGQNLKDQLISRFQHESNGANIGNVNKTTSFLHKSPKQISSMTKNELKTNLPDNWTFHDHSGRVHIKDSNKNFRIRIDPPDKKTQYKHMHIYDENGNPLDINGNIVDKKSPAGHIPWNKE